MARPRRGSSSLSAPAETSQTAVSEVPARSTGPATAGDVSPVPEPIPPTNGNGANAGVVLPPDVELVAAASGPDPPSPLRNWLAWFRGAAVADEGAVTEYPKIETPFKELRKQTFMDGVTHSVVVFDQTKARAQYWVVEPVLTKVQVRALNFVKEVLNRTLDVDLEFDGRTATKESLAYLNDRIGHVVKDYRIRLSPTGLRRVQYFLVRDFIGFGPIDVMMRDPEIEDVSCDGPGVPLYLYHRRFGSLETNVKFEATEELDAFVIRMAQRSGKQITIADPLLDSSLPDGSRLQATLGREVTDNGSTFTIRRFKDDPFSPIDLVRMGTMNAEMLAYFWLIVQNGANIIMSGGTASGKTTTLNAISLFIPPQAKIVSIEDTRELNLPHPNWIRSVTRGGARGSDVKRVDMFDLLTAALRQRPEYILVGEVRGKEATVAFQAMATGHTVYATIHADSARSVVYRLENEPINIPRLVLQSLDTIVLQALIGIKGKRQRRIQQVVEIVGIDPGTKELLTHTVFHRDPATDEFHYTGRSYKLERIAQRNNWTPQQLDTELKRRTGIVTALMQGGPLKFDEISFIAQTADNQPENLPAELDRVITRSKQREAAPG